MSKLKVIKTTPPYIHGASSPRVMMGRMCGILSVILLCSVFYFGFRVLINAVISVLCCLICEAVVSRLVRLPNTVHDMSSVVTGLIIVLACPASVPGWLMVVMAIFAICLAKAPFGGLGHNPFNPAACAIAFASISWPELMLRFPASPQVLPLFSAVPQTAFGQTVQTYLAAGVLPEYSFTDVFFGSVPAAAGTGCYPVLIACFVFLALKGTVRWRISVSYLVTLGILSLAIPRAGGAVDSLFLEIFSGYVVFAAFFMFTDPSTSPKANGSQYAYGLICAVVTMLMRRFGMYREGTCFALIICNAVGPTLDRWGAAFTERRHKIHAKVRKAN